MLDMQDVKFQGLKLAADWIRDLESSDSRLHKESVIEKALMASKLGSSNASCSTAIKPTTPIMCLASRRFLRLKD